MQERNRMLKLGDILTILEKSPRVTIPLAIICSILLIMPCTIYSHIGIVPPAGILRSTIYYLLIAAVISFIFRAVCYSLSCIRLRILPRIHARSMLKSLSGDEKTFLQKHLDNNRRTILCSTGSSVGRSLEKKGILEVCSQSRSDGAVQMSVVNPIWWLLQKKPSYLEGS